MKALLIFLIVTLFLGCGGSSPQTPSIGNATKCEVRFLNLAISGEEVLKEITEASEIASLVSYAEKEILKASNFCHMVKVADRSAVLKVSFYDGATYKGTLGIGSYDKDKFFLKYYNFGVSKVVCISNEEKDEFLKLVGIPLSEQKRFLLVE